VLPGLLIARYLGDSTEEAFDQFRGLWSVLRPAVSGRDAVEPRIWST
jgi:urease accessory protein